MNTTSKYGPESLELAEFDLLVPAPRVPELTVDRHRLLKEFLMNEVERATTPAAVAAAGRRRTVRRLAWGLGPVTVAAAAVAVVLASTGNGPSSVQRAGAPTDGASVGASVGPETAASLLGRIALAAENKPADPVRDDQFVYIEK